MTKFIFAAVAAAIFFAAQTGSASAMGSDNETSMTAPDTDDLYRKAVAAVKAEQYRTAVGLLNKVVEEKPKHPDALNYLGYSHRKLGDYARAVSYYERALSLDADHRGAREYLGQAYVELGNLRGADEQLEKLKGICGTDCEEYKSLKSAIEAASTGKPNQT